MSVQRRYTLTFKQDLVSENMVTKEGKPIQAQIAVPEAEFKNVLIPEEVISETMLLKMVDAIRTQIKNLNFALQQSQQTHKIEEPEMIGPEEQIIIPLNSFKV